MAFILSIDNTFLDVFVSISRSDGTERKILECGDESWTYGDLDAGLALKLHQSMAQIPSWPSSAKITPTSCHDLGFLVRHFETRQCPCPLDYHVRREISERFNRDIAPTYVLPPSTELVLQKGDTLAFSSNFSIR